MTADRSTMEGWLRKLEDAAGDSPDSFTGRAWTFRSILAQVWADGHDRGYRDHRDDVSRAEYARKKTERAAATEKEQQHD